MQQQEGLVEDIINQPDSTTEERQMKAGTSTKMPRIKGKHPMAQSPHTQPNAKIFLPCISKGVQAMHSLLGYVEILQYLDHDVVNAGKLLDFVQQVYLESIGTSPFGDPILQPKPWATILTNTGILNLLEIPHFGRGKEVNKCIKQLMAVLHGGFLWLEELVSIDTWN
jgi:hypothetical protein